MNNIETILEFDKEFVNKKAWMFTFIWNKKDKKTIYIVKFNKTKMQKGEYWYYDIYEQGTWYFCYSEIFNLKNKLTDWIKKKLNILNFKDKDKDKTINFSEKENFDLSIIPKSIKKLWTKKKKYKNIKIKILFWLPGSWKTTYWEKLLFEHGESWLNDKTPIFLINFEKETIKGINNTYHLSDKIENFANKKYTWISEQLIKDIKEISKEDYWNVVFIIDWMIFTKKKDYDFIRERFQEFFNIEIIYFKENRLNCIQNLELRTKLEVMDWDFSRIEIKKLEEKTQQLINIIKKAEIHKPVDFENIIEINVKDYKNDPVQQLKRKLWVKPYIENLYTPCYRYWNWQTRWYGAGFGEHSEDEEYYEKENYISELSVLELTQKEITEMETYFVEEECENLDPYWNWQYKRQKITINDLYIFLKDLGKITN